MKASCFKSVREYQKVRENAAGLKYRSQVNLRPKQKFLGLRGYLLQVFGILSVLVKQ